MMKNIIKLFALSFSLMTLSQSCSLDREPRELISFDNSFKTLNDAKQWDSGLYATLRKLLGGEYVMPQEVQADMLNDCGGEYFTLHGWTMRADGSFFNFYQNYYSVMIDANIIINKIPQIKVTKAEQKELDVYLGDAYFARAFFYFNLAVRWGVPYQESTADVDLCVPLETEPFTVDSKPRATNKVVYTQILEDLNKAEALLASVPSVVGNPEISPDVVKALKARVYLYMNRMEDAYKLSTELIASKNYPLIPALAKDAQDLPGKDNPFVQMWQFDSGVEQIWQPSISKPDELPKGIYLYGADLDSWKKWNNVLSKTDNVNNPSYIPTGTVVYKLFKVQDGQDRRIPAYFEEAWLTNNKEEKKAKAFVVSKFKGNPKYKDVVHSAWGGYLPNAIQAPKPFRIAEQYLIASEAAYNLNKNDEARKYLNELRASRGLDAVEFIAYDLEKAIQDERARELAYEGFRLWDLRRWHLGINGRPRQGTDRPQIYGKDYVIPENFFSVRDNVNLKIEPNNYKFVWAFPYYEVSKINKNIIQNKGW